MNCPHHCEIYKFKPRSYKDLPLRFAEFGTVYRYEQSGELHGLTRVRGFTQDDAHLFCTPDQLKEEFKKVIDIIFTILRRWISKILLLRYLYVIRRIQRSISVRMRTGKKRNVPSSKRLKKKA